VTSLVSKINLPKLNLSGILTWVQQNSVFVGIIASLGTTTLGMAVKYFQTNSLLNKTSNELANTKAEASKESSQITVLKKKLEAYENDTTSGELQSTINKIKTEYNTTLTAKDAQIKELRSNFESLQRQLDARPVIKIPDVK
jgi:Tfp pilus assembly protein PilO